MISDKLKTTTTIGYEAKRHINKDASIHIYLYLIRFEHIYPTEISHVFIDYDDSPYNMDIFERTINNATYNFNKNDFMHVEAIQQVIKLETRLVTKLKRELKS